MLMEADLPEDVEALRALALEQSRSLATERAARADLALAKSEADAEIERLQSIIDAFMRHRFGRKSEQLDPDQLQLGLEDVETALGEARAAREAAQAKPKGDRPRKANRGALPAHLERLEMLKGLWFYNAGRYNGLPLDDRSALEQVLAERRLERLADDGERVAGVDHAPVLRGITAKIPAGERVLVAGRSGTGKSTLLGLLMRFDDPDQGSVTLGGVSLRDLPYDDLAAHIGYVPQDPLVFSGTLGENIGLGRPGATETEIEDAARRARISPP